MERFGKKNNRYRILVAGSLLLQSVLMTALFAICRHRFANRLDLLYFMLLGGTFLINLLAAVMIWRHRQREELLERIRTGKQMERFHRGRQAVEQEIGQEAAETAGRLLMQIKRVRQEAAGPEESSVKDAYRPADDSPADREAAPAQSGNKTHSFTHRRYTANPIVNVVLMEKHLECEEAGIGFAADMFVPAELDIDSYSLSSILANLLDNAIEACLDYQEKTGEQGRILIRSAAKEAYLYLDIVNHCRDAYSRRPRREGHGLGLEIVRDTAENMEEPSRALTGKKSLLQALC